MGIDRQVQHISHSGSFISNVHSVSYITATEVLITDSLFNCFKNNNSQQANVTNSAFTNVTVKF